MPITPTQLAHAWREAYNHQDLAVLLRLFHEQATLTHHGVGKPSVGGEAIVSRLKRGMSGAFSDRRFTKPRRVTASGQTAVVEYDWVATANVDVPGVAQQDETVTTPICAVIVTRDGCIIEYTEYG